MKILLKGDENNKYAITEEGYTVLQSENEWYYAMKDVHGKLVCSPHLASPKQFHTQEITSFLSKTDKCLSPSYDSETQETSALVRNYSSAPVIGERKVLVVLVEFPDCSLTKSKLDFENLFNKPNYYEDGAKGSVSDYYNYVSYGKLNLTCDIVGPYKVRNRMSYYGGNSGIGGNDKNVYSLFEEVLTKLSAEVSLSDYDIDKDGFVDNIHIVYAGYGEEAGASANAIWAHESSFKPVPVQDVFVDRYSCSPELRSNKGNGISRIGCHCHEIGHALGAMDYYDTDYEKNGNYVGTGNWDVMASGSWNEEGVNPANFNPYVKIYNFGWCEEVLLTTDGPLAIPSSDYCDIIYRIDTPKNGEFFLLENRQQTLFDCSVPGHGLLIYHIDGDIENQIKENTINASYPQCCTIVCASSSFKTPTSVSSSYGNINSAGCPFPGSSNNRGFGINTVPAAVCVDGTIAGFSLNDIVENDYEITLDIKFGAPEEFEPDNNDSEIIVWSESFDTSSFETDWKIAKTEGNNLWGLRSTVSVFERNKYIQISPSFLVFDRSKRSVSSAKTPLLSLDDSQYLLSLKVSTTGESRYGKDSLIISFCNEESTVDVLVLILPQTKDWQEYSIPVKSERKQSCSIELKGICYNETSLAVDDIVLFRKGTKETSISQMRNEKREDVGYDLWGNRISLDADLPGFIVLPENHKKIYFQK